MIKRLINKRMILFLLIVLFLSAQILGTIAIKSIFINYKIKELSPRLKYITEEIARGTFVISRNNDFILKAYDIFGVEINLFNDDAHETIGITEPLVSESLVPLIQKVIAGNEVASLIKIRDQGVESIVIGMPIVDEGKVAGVAFLLKPASDFQAVLRGFYLIFSLTLMIGVLTIGFFLSLYLKEIKQLEQLRRDYIANISHELKSPIASIKALTETLSDKMIKDEETREKYYGIILKESSQLQKLISDMLELSRLQSGNLAFKKESICPRVFLQDIFEKYTVLADDMDIRFEITETAFSAPDINSNRDRILQLFNILLSNAIKFVDEDGKIVIDAEVTRKQVKFKVCDNGIGIDKSIMPYIFDRFYKEDTAHNSSGSGLGLSIAKEIIMGLNETISVTSSPQYATIFEFTVQRT